MDLSRFDTRDKSHEGVNVPLVINGEALYSEEDGEPLTFRLRGVADPEVQKIILQQRSATAGRTPEEVLAADLKLARAAVVGWSDNWTLDGQKVPFSKKAIEQVFSIPAIRQAVLAEVFRNGHFMKGP